MCSLDDIPNDIIKDICILLDPIDLIALSLIDKTYYTLIDDKLLTQYILNNKYVTKSSLYKNFMLPYKLTKINITLRNLVNMYIKGFPCLFTYYDYICNNCNKKSNWYTVCHHCNSINITTIISYKIYKITPNMKLEDVKILANTGYIIKLLCKCNKQINKIFIGKRSYWGEINQIQFFNSNNDSIKNILMNKVNIDLYKLEFVIEI
jgi:hypothetical protein